MEFFRSLRYRLQELDQHQIIDLKWLQLWLVTLIATFGALTYLWNWLVAEVDPTSHFPPSLLPPDLRKRLPPHGFISEKEAREFALKEIDIAVVACQKDTDKSDESAVDAVAMMKSAAVLSKSIIHFHIFTEDRLYPTFMLKLDEWPPHLRHRVSFEFSHVTYPESLLGWKNSHRPCSSFKLFIPHILKNLDFVLYLDSDTVFLKSLDILWMKLAEFDERTTLSLAASPIQGTLLSKYGIMSQDTRAVLFDIHKLRHSVLQVPTAITDLGDGKFHFEVENKTWHPNMLHTVYQLFSKEITVPGQDILSVLFHFNRDKMKTLPCSWKFRWHYCKQYLNWMTSRFLNATLSNWPIQFEPPLCNSVSFVHSSSSYFSHDERLEFSLLQQIWRNASYDSLMPGISRQIRDLITTVPSSQFLPCFRVNMKLFAN